MKTAQANPVPATRIVNSLTMRVTLPRKSHVASWGAIALTLVFCIALEVSTVHAQVLKPAASSAPFAGAIISEWKGEVHVQLPGKSLAKPAHGQILLAGTTLEVGNGQLLLVLRTDESEILVQSHTRLRVEEPAPGNWNAVEVLLGRIRAYIRKRTGGAPPFQMGTPSAVIAVRGTRFDVEVNRRQVSEVDVFDGLVEVASRTATGNSVLVHPGFSTRVGIGSSPEPPVPTRDIRPGVDIPEQVAKLEFAREWARQADRVWERELGEREKADLDDTVDESRESEKATH